MSYARDGHGKTLLLCDGCDAATYLNHEYFAGWTFSGLSARCPACAPRTETTADTVTPQEEPND